MDEMNEIGAVLEQGAATAGGVLSDEEELALLDELEELMASTSLSDKAATNSTAVLVSAPSDAKPLSDATGGGRDVRIKEEEVESPSNSAEAVLV